MYKSGEQEKLRKEYEELASSNIDLQFLDNKNPYKSLFPKPNGCEQFGETFYRIGDIVATSQSGKDVLGKSFNKTYFMKVKSKVGDVMRSDEYLKSLFVKSKGKTRTSDFKNIYKSLIALKITHNEIKEYFNLDNDYQKWIKPYL